MLGVARRLFNRNVSSPMRLYFCLSSNNYQIFSDDCGYVNKKHKTRITKTLINLNGEINSLRGMALRKSLGTFEVPTKKAPDA